MNEWHVKKDHRWFRVQSDVRPDGFMVHKLSGKCLYKPCSYFHTPKVPNR